MSGNHLYSIRIQKGVDFLALALKMIIAVMAKKTPKKTDRTGGITGNRRPASSISPKSP